MKICPVCNFENPEDNKYCDECGFDLTKVVISSVDSDKEREEISTSGNEDTDKFPVITEDMIKQNSETADYRTRKLPPLTEPPLGEEEIQQPKKIKDILKKRYKIIEQITSPSPSFELYKAQELKQADNFYLIRRYIDLKEGFEGKKHPSFHEFEMLQTLEHPNIIRVIDHFEEDDELYLVTEFGVAFTSQFDKPTSKQVIDLSFRICKALEYLYQKAIVHLDIREQNILISEEGEIKLAGFTRARHLSETMGVKGAFTEGYSPPELCGLNPSPVDHRSDTFSLGATMYYLLSNDDPSLQGISPIFSTISGISPEIQGIIAKAMAQDMTRRYQTAGEFKEALLPLLAKLRMSFPFTLNIGRSSDVGKRRKINEDSLLTLELSSVEQSAIYLQGLYLVADGMGGESAGEVASSLVIRVVSEYLRSNIFFSEGKLLSDEIIKDKISEAIHRADQAISSYVSDHPETKGMGSTIVLALLLGDTIYIAHVGDSRAYLIKEDGIERLTVDHSLMARLISIGQVTEEEARSHTRRGEIYKAISGKSDVEPDLNKVKLEAGDQILLCSDGLNSMIRDEEIKEIILTSLDPQGACEKLIAAANREGGEDNVTIVLLRFGDRGVNEG